MSEGASSASSELGRLATSLQNPHFRRAFAADPATALAQEAINQDLLPGNVLEALVELSAQELAVLARVRKALEADDVPRDVIVKMV